MDSEALGEAVKKLLGPREKIKVTTPDREERRILQALANLGDEKIADYKEGRMSREEALSIANGRRQELRERGAW